MTPKLTLLAGMPASGKSTWAKRHAGTALVISGDAVRVGKASPRAVFGGMFRDANLALASGRSVVVDACSLRSMDRRPWLAMARRHGARAELVIVNTPATVCAVRDAQRARPAGRYGVFVMRWVAFRRSLAGERWDAIRTVSGGGLK